MAAITQMRYALSCMWPGTPVEPLRRAVFGDAPSRRFPPAAPGQRQDANAPPGGKRAGFWDGMQKVLHCPSQPAVDMLQGPVSRVAEPRPRPVAKAAGHRLPRRQAMGGCSRSRRLRLSEPRTPARRPAPARRCAAWLAGAAARSLARSCSRRWIPRPPWTRSPSCAKAAAGSTRACRTRRRCWRAWGSCLKRCARAPDSQPERADENAAWRALGRRQGPEACVSCAGLTRSGECLQDPARCLYGPVPVAWPRLAARPRETTCQACMTRESLACPPSKCSSTACPDCSLCA